MVKICMLMPQFFPVPAVKGGAVEQLATFLADENEKYNKIDLTFISIADSEAEEVSKNYKNSKFMYIPINLKEEAFDYASTDGVFKEYMSKAEKIINENDFDFVIVEGGKKEHVLNSVPYNKNITYLHGPVIEDGLEKYYSSIIVVSNFVARCYYKKNKENEKYVLPLNNAIHIEDFSKEISDEERKELREKYNIKEDEIVINFCGRTIEEKGVRELIKAFKSTKNLDKCKLLVVGNCNYAKQVKTPFEEELFSLAEDVKDRIVFTGFVPNKELYKIHKISDIATIPSIFEEPFGLTVIEAMASGRPLITSDAGAIPDIVKDKENAIVVKRGEDFISNFANSIDLLVENKELRDDMGKKSQEIVTAYDTPNYYMNFCKIFEDLNNKNNI